MRPGRYAGWLVCGMLLVLDGPGAMADDPPDSPIENFLSRHWQRPLLYQGEAPPRFSALEASLDPRACDNAELNAMAQALDALFQTSGSDAARPWAGRPGSIDNNCR